MRILIVEDEKRIARFIQLELKHEGFETAIEGNGKRAFEKIIQEDYDLVLLDVMLPEMDGIEICRRVRELSDIPIIMLTAKDDIDDKVNGLDVGADDYMTKPFAVPELLARIRATLRNHSNHNNNIYDDDDAFSLTIKNLILFPERSEAQMKIEDKNNQKDERVKLELTDKEYAVLEYLVRNKQVALPREQILDKVWGGHSGKQNVLEDCIQNLTAKIDERFGEKYIQTAGKGYKILEQECSIFFRDLALFPERFEVLFRNESIELTKREYTLLEYLVKNKRNVLTRDQILQTVWGYDYIGDTNVVDVYIRYLRSKIDDHFGEKYIHTVRGVGYVIKE